MVVLTAVGGNPTTDGKGDQRADSQCDADRLVRMGFGGILRRPGTLASLVAKGAGQLLPVIESSGQTMACGIDFFAGNIGCRAHEFSGVVCQVADFVADCLHGFVHSVGAVWDVDDAEGWWGNKEFISSLSSVIDHAPS